MRSAAFAFLILASGSIAAETADCVFLKSISEETAPARCPAHYAMSGARCEGPYCDNIVLTCCRYMADHYVPPGESAERPTPGYNASPGQNDWTAWFSEENGGGTTQTSHQSGLISGLACRGDYCDDIRMLAFSPAARAGATCVWLDPVSEEGNRSAQCPAGRFVKDIKCTGAYCDNISLQCCDAKDSDPRSSFVFAPDPCLKLPQIGREPTLSGIPSNFERTKSRPAWLCPNGFAMRGLECHGGYCSHLNATCCSYGGTDTSGSKYRLSPAFSEEKDAHGVHGASSTKEFVVGVRCSGQYCDNLEAAFLSSPQLKNDAPACRDVGPFSEEDPPQMCRPYEFVSGIKCDGDYCDNLTLTCCTYNGARRALEASQELER